MDETFVEKLARAAARECCKAYPTLPGSIEDDWEPWVPMVLAILRAAREPSRKMLCAGHVEEMLPHERVNYVWQAMIDAALAEHEQKNEDAA